jgi:4-amino-4-deoxy-L-arabinose transferase-like glycosyltransferase
MPNEIRRSGLGLLAGRTQLRVAFAALLLLTAAVYIWDLGATGSANSFYAAAVLAATKSWKAFFFGSLDSSSFITVDKPPASLWVMALSSRVFGFSAWSMLVPQALEGVAAVALLFATVRRWFGDAAGLAAGALLAMTPVAALLFRYNNPDALMTTLLVGSAYCMTHATEGARARWVAGAGALIGLAFLTKMGESLIVVPAFALTYLFAAPGSMRRRVNGLLIGFAALCASGGWWIATVALLPASSRPLIDGSPHNNIFDLILGYNGFGRLLGKGAAMTVGANPGGRPGTLRMFDDVMAGQASWLLPAALIALLSGVWAVRTRPRLDRTRAALLMWGGWLLVATLLFSFSQGTIHSYYAIALAPPIAALVACGAGMLWARRGETRATLLLAFTVAVTGGWSYTVLDRTPEWHPLVRSAVLAATPLAVLAVLATIIVPRTARRTRIVLLGAVAIACLGGPAAYAGSTIVQAHSGAGVAAGPNRYASNSTPGVAPAVLAALRSDASSYRWVAATIGSPQAATYELASGGAPVMAIGGYNGIGRELTLGTFIAYVRAGAVHYFIATPREERSPVDPHGTGRIVAWVQAHFIARRVGSVSLYDLDAGAGR